MGILSAFLALASGAACSLDDLRTEQRRASGLVIILPGIEGRSVYNINLARGLAEGGVKAAIEIREWGTTAPGGAIINLTDYERNLAQARALAESIEEYQSAYPGRAVHLLGHSGGAGLAVMALEQLPRESTVTSAILLAAAISPRHDMREALRRTRYGIFNYHSKLDMAFLGVGTSVLGTIDREFAAAAGAVGFERPRELTSEDRKLYARLHEVPWTTRMADAGNLGDHFGWTHRPFVRQYLAPLVRELSIRQWRTAAASPPADAIASR